MKRSLWRRLQFPHPLLHRIAHFVRPRPKNDPDDFFAPNCNVYVERMAENVIYIGVTAPNGQRKVMTLYSKWTIEWRIEDDE